MGEINNSDNQPSGLYRIGYMNDGNYYQKAPNMGSVVMPAEAKEDAAALGPEYFQDHLPVTVAEEDRFVELFGYYPYGMG